MYAEIKKFWYIDIDFPILDSTVSIDIVLNLILPTQNPKRT